MINSKVKPLERKVLRDTVYESLLAMLLSGELQANTALNIDALANQLSVSPTPVREALAHLESTGLVTRAPLRGYRVAPLMGPTQIDQLYQARIALECAALGCAFNNWDEFATQLALRHEEHAQAAAVIANIVPSKQSLDSYRAYMDADWRFHQEIFLATKNPYFLQLNDSLPTHTHRLHQSINYGINDAKFTVPEHEAILSAVLAQDEPAASAALAQHLDNAKRRTMADAQRILG